MTWLTVVLLLVHSLQYVHALHSELNDIKTELTRLTARIDSLETDNDSKTKKIHQLEKEVEALTDQNDVLAKKRGTDVPRNVTLDGLAFHTEKVRQASALKIAFTAVVGPHDYGPLSGGQTIVLDTIVTNLGAAYHPHSGTFIAPVNGVYMFFVTVGGNLNHNTENYAHILLNGLVVNKALASHFEQSSKSCILQLTTNDEVYVVNAANGDTFLGDTYTSFSGFLLYQNE